MKPSLCFCVTSTPYLRRRRDAVNEHSKFCVASTRCSAIHRQAARGVWRCVCVVSGGYSRSLAFSSGHSKQHNSSDGDRGGAAVFGVGAHQYWGTNAYFANVEAQVTEKTWLKNHCKVQSNNTTHTHLTIYIYIYIYTYKLYTTKLQSFGFESFFLENSQSIFMYQSVDFKHDIRSPVLSQRTNHSACGPRQRDA